jgi:hypothetical protein
MAKHPGKKPGFSLKTWFLRYATLPGTLMVGSGFGFEAAQAHALAFFFFETRPGVNHQEMAITP